MAHQAGSLLDRWTWSARAWFTRSADGFTSLLVEKYGPEFFVDWKPAEQEHYAVLREAEESHGISQPNGWILASCVLASLVMILTWAGITTDKEIAARQKELNIDQATGVSVNETIRNADRMVATTKKTAADATLRSADLEVIAKHAGRIAEVLTRRAADAEKQALAAAESRKATPLPAVQPLTGLKGFCPVALRDQRQLVKARPEFAITHEGHVVLLSSAAARKAFLASPTLYLPAADGQDVVTLGDKQPQPGSLDHATWYREQLYLFASLDNLATFTQQPGRYTR